MDANDEHNELTDADDVPDEFTDVPAYRERATSRLQDIAQETKHALADAGIDIALFFMVPHSGDAIVTFGTVADPDDSEWQTISAIVASVVRRAIGLGRSRCRPVMCATTDTIADDPPTESPAQPAEPSGCRAVPMPASALQHAGAEQ